MPPERTNRYVTKSDRFVVYRHPVARPVSDELFNSIRRRWSRLVKAYEKNPAKAGIVMFLLLQEMFKTGDRNIFFDSMLAEFTEYDEDDCELLTVEEQIDKLLE